MRVRWSALELMWCRLSPIEKKHELEETKRGDEGERERISSDWAEVGGRLGPFGCK